MKAIPLALFLMFILLCGFNSSAQNIVERQHRIKKAQFPIESFEVLLTDYQDIKRLKFYREVDTATITYTAKFKKARLFYEIDFTEDYEAKTIAFKVNQVDIPEERFERITSYLKKRFEKSKTRQMLQSYPFGGTEAQETTLRNAFQNLMVPTMNYILLVRGKNEGKAADYKVVFDAEGNFKALHKALPANYDRVLY